jgi:hypothetical protein
MTPVDQSQQRFLRDLAFLLGVPAIVVAILMAWWKPWTYRPHGVMTFPHRTNEARARAGGLREATWHGVELSVPGEYVILSLDSVVEIVEQYPPQYGNGNWGSHIAFLPLTVAARQRLEQRRENCSLAPDRCWEKQVGSHQLRCQQGAGAPVPELWWTPLAICEARDLDLWVAVNAREEQRASAWELVERVLSDAPRYDPKAPSAPSAH